jgi:hypothetical protein
VAATEITEGTEETVPPQSNGVTEKRDASVKSAARLRAACQESNLGGDLADEGDAYGRRAIYCPPT